MRTATELARNNLGQRAAQLRVKFGFPIIQGMSFALTNKLERATSEGKQPNVNATLAAWYHLDVEQNPLTPIPSRFVGNVVTHIIEEHHVVFREGY